MMVKILSPDSVNAIEIIHSDGISAGETRSNSKRVNLIFFTGTIPEGFQTVAGG